MFPRGGLPELVAHQVNGYVCDSADAAGLIHGIMFFLASRELWPRASEAAMRSAARHSPEAIRPEWESVFEECMTA